MEHPKYIKGYEEKNKELARDLANLHYVNLFDIVSDLAMFLREDSLKDKDRGRSDLAGHLYKAYEHMLESSNSLAFCADIANRHTDSEED